MTRARVPCNFKLPMTSQLQGIIALSMFHFSTAFANTFPENSYSEEIEKSTSTPILPEQENERNYCFSDTVSEPGHLEELPGLQFIKSPFKLIRKGSKSSRGAKNMQASDPPTPNPSSASDISLPDPDRGVTAVTVAEMLERPVALSARLRFDCKLHTKYSIKSQSLFKTEARWKRKKILTLNNSIAINFLKFSDRIQCSKSERVYDELSVLQSTSHFVLREHLQNLSITDGESEHPFAISFEDVAAAAFRIRKGIVKTPCEVRTGELISVLLCIILIPLY